VLLVGARRLRLSAALPALVLLARTLVDLPLFAEIGNGDISLLVVLPSSAIRPSVECRVHIQNNQLLPFPHRHLRRLFRGEIVESRHLVDGDGRVLSAVDLVRHNLRCDQGFVL